jgi:CheY-like chemotaxis protein
MIRQGPGLVFVGIVQDVLQAFYNPSELLRSPLVSLFSLENEREPAGALRRIFREAIRSLKTEENAPRHSAAWRVYYVLNSRYLEQLCQKEVADEMALSTRQIRRYEREAAELLANALWKQLPPPQQAAFQESEEQFPQPPAPLDDPIQEEDLAENRPEEREQELSWLKTSVPIEPMSVANVISAALKTAAPLIQGLNEAIRYEVPDHLPPLVGQASSIKQALLELLTGAVQFAPGGEVSVSAVASPDKIQIVVSASGGTLPKQITTQDLSGKMRMVAQLAALSGGELDYTDPGQKEGRFSASLALPAAEQVRVLAIDDNQDALQLFHLFLAGTQFKLTTLREPGKIFDSIQQSQPMVILMDVMLPGIDGWELLGQLREHPRARSIPVVITTILMQEELAMSLGAAGFLRKPFTREAILGMLDQVLAA